jgi:hypothetical protein
MSLTLITILSGSISSSCVSFAHYLELISRLDSWNDNFWLKNDGEKWSRIFYFEIEGAPLDIPANLPFGADFFALGSNNSKGASSI